MKIMIMGGTGLLGYHAVKDALRKGHDVTTLTVPDIHLGEWFPKAASVHYGDVFTMQSDDLVAELQGFDALIYAIGPDERYVPKAPAYDFFHEHLVEGCGRVLACARKAGIGAVAVCNSYFAYFDRIWPEAHLAVRHPYIKVRIEQAERCLAEGQGSMSVAILELPYIFGTIPARVPLWKETLLDRLKGMNPIIYTNGGSAMITAGHTGQALVGAVERRADGRFPIGDVNMSWKDMLQHICAALGLQRKILILPDALTFLPALYGTTIKMQEQAAGRQGGLDHAKMFYDIMRKFMYIDAGASAVALGYARGGVEQAIAETVRACYPDERLT
ncbi:MAG TPA: NAD(P)-dependent oxidoreductase [Anaerolineales bacterium]|nr:NAD(P)-dependent oxidoreductase [Anaerolineales bacterium]